MSELRAQEQLAKKDKTGIWSGDFKIDQGGRNAQGPQGEIVPVGSQIKPENVTITEIIHAQEFYYSDTKSEQLE